MQRASKSVRCQTISSLFQHHVKSRKHASNLCQHLQQPVSSNSGTNVSSDKSLQILSTTTSAPVSRTVSRGDCAAEINRYLADAANKPAGNNLKLVPRHVETTGSVYCLTGTGWIWGSTKPPTAETWTKIDMSKDNNERKHSKS